MAVADLQTSAYAILALLTGICTWYKPDGRLSVTELVAVHTALVLEGCGLATGACSRPPVRSTPAAPHAERAPVPGSDGQGPCPVTLTQPLPKGAGFIGQAASASASATRPRIMSAALAAIIRVVA